MTIERTNPESVFQPPADAKYTQMLSTTGEKQIYISGVLAKNADNKIVGVGDMEKQARKVLENIRKCLQCEGATFSDVVRRRVFTVDMERFLDIQRTVYADFWTADESPASTLVQIESLADSHHDGVAEGEPTDIEPRFLVEIDVTAVVAK